MADYIDIKTPVIENITWTPAPVTVGASVKIAAQITEQVTRRMYPMPFSSGEISAGGEG